MYELTLYYDDKMQTIRYTSMDDALANLPECVVNEVPDGTWSWRFSAPMECHIRFTNLRLDMDIWDDLELKKRWLKVLAPLMMKGLE